MSHILSYRLWSEKVWTHNQPFNKYSSSPKLDMIVKTTTNQLLYFLKEKFSKGQSIEF